MKTKTVRNIGYSIATTATISLMQFVASIVLARTLTPQDYGIVGFALIFINFMAQFSDFGINSALIQNNNLDTATTETALLIKIILSSFMTAVLFLLAPMSHYFMGQPEVVPVIRLLSLNFLVSVFGFLPQVLLTRELNYRRLILPQTVSVAAGSLCSIVLALQGNGYWSIVGGSLLTTIVSTVLLVTLRPVSLRLGYDAEVARRLLHFGGNMLLPGVIVFFIFNTDNFVLGAIKGAEQLGYYAIAFTWGSMICVLLSGSLHKVLFPTFSKLQHDRTAMKKAYLTSLHYIAFLAVPANLLLALEARGFLLWILGQGSDRWLPALLTFQILCVYGIFRALLEPASNVILGLGRPQLFLRAIMLVALLQLSLLYPAITFFGMEGVAVTVTIAYLSQYSIYIPIMNRELNVTASELFGEICSTVAAAAVMSIVILAMKLFTVFSLTTTVVETGLGFLLYLSVFGMMDRGKLYREAWTLAQAHP